MTAETITARVTHRFAAASERVFDAWLDPAKVRVWMGLPFAWGALDLRRVEIDPRVGGRFVFSDMREGGEAVHWGEYRVIERPHRLVFTWWTSAEEEVADSSVVSLTFTPEPEGCTVTLEHEMDAKWADIVEGARGSWLGMLRHVDDMLAGNG